MGRCGQDRNAESAADRGAEDPGHAIDGHAHAPADHERDHDHSHDTGSTGSRRLAAVSLINLAGFAVEFAGVLLFGSVALLSDAVHMLFDALAYVVAWAAAHVAERYGADERWSYGLHRLEPLAAFLNGLLLLPMVGFVLWEAYRRFLAPVEIGVGPTLAIATGGLVVNVGSVYVLGGEDLSLNERGALYHLLGDAGGSVAVIVSTVVVATTGTRWVDPVAAGLIALLVTWSAARVIRGSGEIFLLRTPVDAAAIRREIEDIQGVERVEDLHAWQVCSQLTVATTHVETDAETVEEAEDLTRRIYAVLEGSDVDHATVELCPPLANRPTHLAAHGH